MRFKVRTALAAIAVLALYLGWEINGWRSWRVRSNYLRLATTAARYENENLAMLQSKRAQLARLKKSDPSQLTDLAAPAQGFYRSKAARAAEQLANQDRLARETESLLVEVAAFAERRSKYERAAAHPWRAVEPDRAPPEPQRDADYWLGVSDYERALAAYDLLARTYPDLVEAHSTSAWIRATCPDARHRNGKIAVASATKACELTNWQDAGELSILAAAFAEAGDFTQAVRWQQKVIGMIADPRSVQVCRNRLAMFMAAEPYRQK